MMTFLFSFLFLISFNSYAWTLNSQTPIYFPSDTVTINVATNDSCTNAGITHTQLLDDAFEAADKYWNKVPTSRLRFKKGSLKAVDAYDPSTGSAGGATSGEVLVGCKDVTTFNTLGAIAVGGTSSSNGAILKSVVSVDGASGSSYGSTSKNVKLAILAHELGHAFGLGHSENDALMYYSVVQTRLKLSLDDMAAVSFLYPREATAGVVGGCATISENGSGPFMTSLLLGLLIVALSKQAFLKTKKLTRVL